MHTEIETLLHYSFWANDQVLDGVARLSREQLQAPLRPGWLSPLEVLVHILAAERIWLSRLQGQSPNRLLTTDDIRNLEDLRAAWVPLRAELMDYVGSIEDSNQVIVYRTTKGVEFQSTLWQLLLHMINHGTEHRAQIALNLAMQGIDVGGLDLIFYLRNVP
jgi:uncharacterized damage-inducible protein DinB